jgi:uncharacterized protein
MPLNDQQRIAVLDVLRGFAIVSILLLHNIEHFDFYHKPEGQPTWLNTIDKHIWDTLFFLFAGKSYAIFALLFGVTFHIQSHSRAKTGEPFAGRFTWRMILLLGFGIVNSCFYQGDILSIYAVIGLCIIPFEKSSNRILLVTAIILLLQPVFWGQVIYAFFSPGLEVKDPQSWTYFGLSTEYLTNGNFVQVVTGNLTNGKKAVVLWNWENGRVFQTLALFLLGILAGRTGVFKASMENNRWWKRTFWIALLLFIPLFFVGKQLSDLVSYKAMLRPLEGIFASWSNFCFMIVLVSTIVLLYYKGISGTFFRFFVPLGKMSLTNYMMQSIIGSCLYYGFGFGLYQYTGATVCLCIGLVLAILQQWFCRWWLRSHDKGVLEGLWHRWTWGRE